MDTHQRWPELKIADWQGTQSTLHLWTQIVGKIRMHLEPFVNQWWNVTLYVTQTGLTTSVMPYRGGRSFTIEFDFVTHSLGIEDCDGELGGFSLEPMTVSEFYRKLMSELDRMNLRVRISTMPNEIVDAIPFEVDTIHGSYDRAAATRFFRALTQGDRLCKRFRSDYTGKASPVHFFWGSFDLAASRFSGRPAPPHPGGFPNMPDSATREAYSHEEFSYGLWFGGNGAEAMFYAYAYPQPPGYEGAAIEPAAAAWNEQLREFVLPYDAVRTSPTRDRDVLSFFQSTYEAAADLQHWDRAALERR